MTWEADSKKRNAFFERKLRVNQVGGYYWHVPSAQRLVWVAEPKANTDLVAVLCATDLNLHETGPVSATQLSDCVRWLELEIVAGAPMQRTPRGTLCIAKAIPAKAIQPPSWPVEQTP